MEKAKISVEKLERRQLRSCNRCHARNHDSSFNVESMADAMYHVTVEGVFELALCDMCLIEYWAEIGKAINVMKEDTPA